jgi:sulfate-transporting ATPase
MAQYVYTMNRVGKIVPPKRHILKDISLSFFPGAKIGVLGLNGSGKSTLLKIMAGVDKDIEGEAIPMPGMKVGYLPQEPQLEPRARTVREAVEEGMGECAGRQGRWTRSTPPMPSPTPTFDALAAEQARAGGHHRHRRHRHRAPAGNRRRRAAPAALGRQDRRAVGRRKAPRGPVPPAAVQARHAAAGRAHQPPGRRKRGLAGAVSCSAFPGTVVAITHDRYFLDNAAEWILELDRGAGIPWKGNYSSWLEQKEARLEQEQKGEEARAKAMKKELEWVRQNPKAARPRARRAWPASRN